MKKEYISDVWQLKQKGHENFEFIDATVNDDNLFKAYNTCNRQAMRCLLSHAGKQNATRLGYGNDDNGKGNTADGLLEIFQPLEQLISSIKTIGKAEDLPLLIPGFAEDGMSDLLTNILHECLNEFTMVQMHKYDIQSNGTKMFYTWDMHAGEWKKVEKPVYFVNGKELLLVPKNIVRKNYLFGMSQYFTRIILERMIDEGGYRRTDGKAIPKKEIVKSKRYSSEHWQYDEAIKYTVENNDVLDEYHRKLPGFYMEHGKPMTDEELDFVIYGYVDAKSA
ncbi:MAG: hypothetical protein ACLSHX_02080 [Suilimivivens sp.]